VTHFPGEASAERAAQAHRHGNEGWHSRQAGEHNVPQNLYSEIRERQVRQLSHRQREHATPLWPRVSSRWWFWQIVAPDALSSVCRSIFSLCMLVRARTRAARSLPLALQMILLQARDVYVAFTFHHVYVDIVKLLQLSRVTLSRSLGRAAQHRRSIMQSCELIRRFIATCRARDDRENPRLPPFGTAKVPCKSRIRCWSLGFSHQI